MSLQPNDKKSKRRSSWNSKDEGATTPTNNNNNTPSSTAAISPSTSTPPSSSSSATSASTEAVKKERRKSWGLPNTIKQNRGVISPSPGTGSTLVPASGRGAPESSSSASFPSAQVPTTSRLDGASKSPYLLPPGDHLIASALDLILGSMQQPGRGVSIKDRKHFFKTHKSCFIGSKAVDWFVERLKCNRQRGIDIAQALCDYGCIVSPTGSAKDHRFRDDKVFYQFTHFIAPAKDSDLLLESAMEVLFGEDEVDSDEGDGENNNNEHPEIEEGSVLSSSLLEVVTAMVSEASQGGGGGGGTGSGSGGGIPKKGSRLMFERRERTSSTETIEIPQSSGHQRKTSISNAPSPSTIVSGTVSKARKIGGKKLAQSTNNKRGGGNGNGGGGGGGADIGLSDLEDLKFETVEGVCKVRLGSVLRLTELLIASPTIDTPYRDAFLLTYTTFTTPEELFNVLAQFWRDAQDYEDVTATRSLEQRTITFMKAWFEKWPDDILPISTKIAEFIKQNLAERYGVLASRLLKLVEAEARDSPNVTRHHRRHYKFDLTSVPPSPSELSTPEEGFMNWSNVDVAQQWALYSHSLYLRIEEHELVGQGWSKKNATELSPNVLACIAAFNRLSWLVMTEIVANIFLKDRVASVQKYIDLATQLATIHDFSGCMAIYSALNSAPIQRLKKTWEALSPDVKEKLEQLNELLSHNKNYSNLRSNFRNTQPPLIPYLGIYLQDLTFIEEIPAKMGELVNFAKCWKLASTISEVLEYRTSIYPFELNPKIISWVVNTPVKKEEEIYSISLKVEPRDLEKAIQQMMEQETQYKTQIQQLEVQVNELVKSNKQQTKTVDNHRSSSQITTHLLVKARDTLLAHSSALNCEESEVLKSISKFLEANGPPQLKMLGNYSKSFSKTNGSLPTTPKAVHRSLEDEEAVKAQATPTPAPTSVTVPADTVVPSEEATPIPT